MPIWILRHQRSSRILCNDGKMRYAAHWGCGSRGIKVYRTEGWAVRRLGQLGQDADGASRFVAIVLYPSDRLDVLTNEVIRS